MRQIGLYLGACYRDVALSDNVSHLLEKFIIVESFEFKESGDLNSGNSLSYFDGPASTYQPPWPVKKNISIDPYVLENIMNDMQLSLLWERCPAFFRYRYFNGVSRYNKQVDIVISALNWLQINNVSTLVFAYEPHNLWIYLLKQTALAINCNCIIATLSSLPWRCFATSQQSIDEPISLLMPKMTSKANSNHCIERFINEKKGDYSTAKPFYETKKYLKSMRIKKSSPRHLVNYGLEALHKNKLNALSTKRKHFLSKRYISFYLSYQPESTTLPDGGLFASLQPAIRYLAGFCLSQNILLVVREHPSTFRWGIDLKWRPPNFYKNILAISSNIILDHFDEDSYELMQNSAAVASVSGTVILESALHNKSIIALGKHQLKNFEHTQFIDLHKNQYNSSSLHALFEPFNGQSDRPISESIVDYLMNLHQITFGSDDEYVGNISMNPRVLRHYRKSAILSILEFIAKDD